MLYLPDMGEAGIAHRSSQVARLTARVPWLCVPTSRRVCSFLSLLQCYDSDTLAAIGPWSQIGHTLAPAPDPESARVRDWV